MVLTADHASMPDPAVSGGFQISTGPMQTMINERFGRPGLSDRYGMQPDQGAAASPCPAKPGSFGNRIHISPLPQAAPGER